jgi:NADPH-dependent 2,4-dienoyl-CoA reductase/sulfur reductase-like enzyme
MHLISKQFELVVIGGGPAGLAAAYSAWQNGLRKILIVERDRELGGILNQCIHNGFGLEYFNEELTGPEYASRFIRLLRDTDIEVLPDTMALEITSGREVHIAGKASGYAVLSAQSIVLATGCRERARGAAGIPGARPAGIITAGAAQRYVNMEGYMPGKRIVIVGSGDVGLIMARRMTLEGAKVLACVEIMPKSGGLMRNIVQCLHDYGIPLLLSHTVTDIRGKVRVEGVTVSEVDENRRLKRGGEKTFECDTVLLSVGLIPENELAHAAGIGIDGQHIHTSVPGIFVCGNALHVHDIVDNVTIEAMGAGAAAAEYVLSGGGAA